MCCGGTAAAAAAIEGRSLPLPCDPLPFLRPQDVNEACDVNEVICHGIPDLRPLEDGDIVNIDVSSYYKGCHGDLNETFLVGNVDEAGRARGQRPRRPVV